MARPLSKPIPAGFEVGGIGNERLALSVRGSALPVPEEGTSPSNLETDFLSQWCGCLSCGFLQTPPNVGAWIPIVFICNRLPTRAPGNALSRPQPPITESFGAFGSGPEGFSGKEGYWLVFIICLVFDAFSFDVAK